MTPLAFIDSRANGHGQKEPYLSRIEVLVATGGSSKITGYALMPQIQLPKSLDESQERREKRKHKNQEVHV